MFNNQIMLLEQLEGWDRFVAKRPTFKTVQEWVLIAEHLAEENGGVLRYKLWLEANGYAGLANAIRKNPTAFSHIKQENRKDRTPASWVPVAIKLSQQHAYGLPHDFWLRKNGYNGLAQIVRKYPELFKDIKQQKKFKSTQEWVEIAEALMLEHGGSIPNCKWLQKNGYSALDYCMRRYPSFFAHLPQYRGKQ